MKFHQLLILGLFWVTLSACQNNKKAQVNIVYDQVANFTEYKLSPDAFSTTSTSGIFVQYNIKQISNTGSEAQTFNFQKGKVVAITSDSTSNEEPSGDNILLGAKLANNITVLAGQTLTNVGCIIKNVLTPNPQNYANTSGSVDLLHQVNSAQPVSMKRAQNDNSVALVVTALPNTLQNLCVK